MPRDKNIDPRLTARACLEDGDLTEAQVWATIHVGDAIHRLAKATESEDVRRARLRAAEERAA